MSYNLIQNDIYSVFSGASAIAAFYPSTYNGEINTSQTFGRISVINGKTELVAHNCVKQYNGLLIVSIFAKSDKEFVRVSDALDQLFQVKILPNGTQMGVSHTTAATQDVLDKTLFRTDYRIEFKFTENI